MDEFGQGNYCSQMIESLKVNLAKWGHYFSVVNDCENILKELTKVYSEREPARIQDYVAMLMGVRSFRLAISGIYLGLSGYPDSVPNLCRTIGEIGIKLIQMKDDPGKFAIGFLLSGNENEIQMVIAESDFRRERRIDDKGFERSLGVLNKQKEKLVKLAKDMGHNPKTAIKKYKDAMKLKTIHELGSPELDRWRQVDYIWDCAFIHGGNEVTYLFSDPAKDKMWLNLGTSGCSEECFAATWDLIMTLAMSIAASSEIFEDSAIIEKSRLLLENINEKHDSISKEVL